MRVRQLSRRGSRVLQRLQQRLKAGGGAHGAAGRGPGFLRHGERRQPRAPCPEPPARGRAAASRPKMAARRRDGRRAGPGSGGSANGERREAGLRAEAEGGERRPAIGRFPRPCGPAADWWRRRRGRGEGLSVKGGGEAGRLRARRARPRPGNAAVTLASDWK